MAHIPRWILCILVWLIASVSSDDQEGLRGLVDARWISSPVCDGSRVQCSGNKVLRILLPEQNQGVKSRSLAMFSMFPSLIELDLSSNHLAGSVDHLQTLTALIKLDLSNNSLSGDIDSLSELTSLQTLQLSSNQFRGDLSALQNMTQLRTLAVDDNLFNGTLQPLTKLTSLQYLNVSFNRLAGTFEPLADQLLLSTLSSSSNHFEGSLWPLQNLTVLSSLNVSVNQLTGSLLPLQSLTNLVVLLVAQNQLTGSLDSLESLTNLVTLNLNANDLTGPLESIQNLTFLRTLRIGSNLLAGNLQPLHQLQFMQTLSLPNNRLEATLDPLQSLDELEYLDLSFNVITGLLDPLSQLTALKALKLNQNSINGTLESLQNLTKLESLILHDNQLSGTLRGLRNAAGLTMLGLSSNELVGTLDPLRNLISLTALHLSFNDFSGSLEPLQGTNFVDVDLSFNELNGTLHPLRTMTALRELYLTQNGFHGPIEPLTNLKHLGALWLSFNQLTGTLSSVQSMTGLAVLDVSYNRLHGPLSYLQRLTSLKSLALAGNKFSDTLDPLGHMTSLLEIDVSANNLTGDLLPLQNLSINHLNLGSNNLAGSLSPLFTNDDLIWLNLSQNNFNLLDFNFSGIWDNLTVLDMSGNKIQGSVDVHMPNLVVLQISDNELRGSVNNITLNPTSSLALLSGQNFVCPFPVVRPTMAFVHDVCDVDYLAIVTILSILVGFLVIVIAVIVCMKRKAPATLEKLKKRAEERPLRWWIQFAKYAMLTQDLITDMVFLSTLVHELPIPLPDFCKPFNDPIVFINFMPPLIGPGGVVTKPEGFKNFAGYLNTIPRFYVESSLASFKKQCQLFSFPPVSPLAWLGDEARSCKNTGPPSYECYMEVDDDDGAVAHSKFFGFVLAFLLIYILKELIKVGFVVYCWRDPSIIKTRHLVISSSVFHPILLLKYPASLIVYQPQSATEYYWRVLYEGVLEAFPQLYILLYYNYFINQRGFSYANVMSCVGTVGGAVWITARAIMKCQKKRTKKKGTDEAQSEEDMLMDKTNNTNATESGTATPEPNSETTEQNADNGATAIESTPLFYNSERPLET